MPGGKDQNRAAAYDHDTRCLAGARRGCGVGKIRARTVVEPVPAPYACTYVLHPAHNIACDTRYRSTRALPCDQPVWVYGNVCEIDLGLGFYRPCE